MLEERLKGRKDINQCVCSVDSAENQQNYIAEIDLTDVVLVC